jgi:hypothetical protein
MNYKIYIKGKMLHLVDEDGQDFEALANDAYVTKRFETDSTFYFKNFPTFNDRNVLELTELRDEENNTFTLEEFNSFISNIGEKSGVFGYASGVSGTETLTGGKKVKSISAYSSAGGTLQINGGDSIAIPANGSVDIPCDYSLVDPTIIFTTTTTYLITYIS